MHGRRVAILLPCCMAFAAVAFAMPDLAGRRAVGSTMVFPDDRRADLFYYAPLELRVVTGVDGRPEFSFVDMRYTGSGLSRDQGLVLHRSLLTMRVELPSRTAEELAACARTLAGAGRAPELRPLPIRRIEAALVYTSIGGDSASGALPGGRIQGSRDSEGPPDDEYWNERVFTVGVDSLTAQMLHSTLAQGQLSMSLGFAFVADGRLAAEPWGGVDGPPAVTDALRGQLSAAAETAAVRDSALRRVVVAGAIPVRVDARRWPDLLRRVDVGDASGFAALDLYCYDFRDNRRPDLYERQVEVEAESVGGRPVRLHAAFARAHPDVYSVSLRFPVAVKLDRPYRYRVTDVRSDGSSRQGSWSSGRNWIGLLDVTTPPFPTARGVRAIR